MHACPVLHKCKIGNPRVGRFFMVDPLAPKYPYNSPYAFSENRVIDGVELEGLEVYSFHLDLKAHEVTFISVVDADYINIRFTIVEPSWFGYGTAGDLSKNFSNKTSAWKYFLEKFNEIRLNEEEPPVIWVESGKHRKPYGLEEWLSTLDAESGSEMGKALGAAENEASNTNSVEGPNNMSPSNSVNITNSNKGGGSGSVRIRPYDKKTDSIIKRFVEGTSTPSGLLDFYYDTLPKLEIEAEKKRNGGQPDYGNPEKLKR